MATAPRELPPIEVGFHVFPLDGEEEFGAVRDVLPEGRLVVDIENTGDVVISLEAVQDVVEQKVLVDLSKLDRTIRFAIAHAHDAEEF